MSSAAKRLAQLSKTLGDLDKVMVTTAVKVVSDALDKQVARDTGGDGVMSGFGKKRTKIGVTVKPLSTQGAGARVVPAPKTAGQWTILDSGAKSHDVVAKGAPIKGKGAKRARRQRDLDVAFGATGAHAGSKPLKTPFGPRYRVKGVHSPAKHTWVKAREAGVASAVKAVRAEFHKAVGS